MEIDVVKTPKPLNMDSLKCTHKFTVLRSEVDSQPLRELSNDGDLAFVFCCEDNWLVVSVQRLEGDLEVAPGGVGGIDYRAADPESASRQGSSRGLGFQGAAIVMEKRDWSVVSMADWERGRPARTANTRTTRNHSVVLPGA